MGTAISQFFVDDMYFAVPKHQNDNDNKNQIYICVCVHSLYMSCHAFEMNSYVIAKATHVLYIIAAQVRVCDIYLSQFHDT